MLAKTLVKLVDEAILPAVALVAAADFLKANSYSALVMFGIMLLFTLWVLFKSHVLHDSHITPFTSVKLISFNLSSLIQSSFEIYSQATVWLSYCWLTTVLLGILTFSGLIYPWVFYLALGLSLITSVIMILDIEREIVIKKEDLLEPSNSYV